MTGYLTKADPKEQGKSVTLRIPNAEIAGIFQDTVMTQDMRYYRDFVEYYEILCYGIAFYQKEAFVKKLDVNVENP